MARPLIERANPSLVAPLDAVGELMGQPLPEGRLVAEEAGALAPELGSWLASLDEGAFPRDDLRGLLGSIAGDPERFRESTSDWDAAAQLFLAMRALVRSDAGAIASRGEASPDEVARLRGRFEALGRIGDALAFPDDHADSPGPQGEPDPWSEDPRPVVVEIRTLLDDLTTGGEEPTGGSSPTTLP